MINYFLEEDFRGLNQEIAHICDKIKDAGREMGLSCQEGAETFHDNFAYEEGERQQYMWSKRLREIIAIRNNSRVVTPDSGTTRVSLGKKVTIRDNATGETKTFKIGSFMVFSQETETISYPAPLARLVIGAEAGEMREG